MTVRAVHHLNCATMCPLAGWTMGQPVGWGRGRMVAHCLLVETERDGHVLIDTGFGMNDVTGRTHLAAGFRRLVAPRLDPAETAVSQVAALGLKPEDVRHLIVTHLDLDHAGGIPDFPNARVHLHLREHAAAMARTSLRERERYMTAHWAHRPNWELYSEEGDTWRGLPAITKLRGLDADIGLLPMYGHTRGHSAVIVNAGKRWLVHAGDAYFHHNTVEGNSPVPIAFRAFERAVEMDPKARRASAAALRQLRASYDDLDLFCAHDAAEFDALAARAN